MFLRIVADYGCLGSSQRSVSKPFAFGNLFAYSNGDSISGFKGPAWLSGKVFDS